MSYSWFRNSSEAGTSIGLRHAYGGQFSSGKTLVRTLFGCQMTVLCPMWAHDVLVGEPVFYGVQTVRASFGGSIPDPAISPLAELSYPSERWLYWASAPLLSAGFRNYDTPYSLVSLATPGTLDQKQCETGVKDNYPAEDIFVYVSVSCPTLVNLGFEATTATWCAGLVKT